MSRHFRLWVFAALACTTLGCRIGSSARGAWPPADFQLDVEYAVEQGGVRQVRQRLRVTADGLVVYREADASVRAGDGTWAYPCFRRLCAYRLNWRSVRSLSRVLHDAPVRDLTAPDPAPRVDGIDHTLHFELTYLGNRVDVVAHNQVIGLMNRVLRIVNQFLPEGAAFTMPEMAGQPLPPCLQDVPAVVDSLAGSLRYHAAWMDTEGSGEEPARAAFALACAADEPRLAARCIARIAETQPAEAASMQRILDGPPAHRAPRRP